MCARRWRRPSRAPRRTAAARCAPPTCNDGFGCRPPMQDVALAIMRAMAERGARVGWAATPVGAIRFAVRGPEHAPPLLLIHGLGDSLAGSAQVAGPLARGHRVHPLGLP